MQRPTFFVCNFLHLYFTINTLGASAPNTTLPQDVIGQKPDSIEEKIKDMDNDYFIVEKHECSDTIDKGLVTRIDPEAGSDAESGSTVTIYISKGKKKVMPDVIGMDIKKAKKKLKKLGASVEITKKYSKKKKNTVIKADWKKGKELPDNAEVKLIV